MTRGQRKVHLLVWLILAAALPLGLALAVWARRPGPAPSAAQPWPSNEGAP